MKRIAILLSALALTACAGGPKPTPKAPTPPPAPVREPRPAAPLPPVVSAPVPNPSPRPRPRPAAPQSPPRASAPADTCGAKALASLVGKPRTEIPIPNNPRARRVTCTSCPVTMDYNPERLNIFFDAQSGIVKEVKCG